MAKNQSTPTSILDDLVIIIVKLDEIYADSEVGDAKRQQANRIATTLRKYHLSLFAAEFNTATNAYKDEVAALQTVAKRAKSTLTTIQNVADALATAAQVVDAAAAVLAKAVKIGLI